MSTYNEAFWEVVRRHSDSSAGPILKAAFLGTPPRTLVDVGCGLGIFGQRAKELGVEEVWGIDADYVPKDQLRIDPAHFITADFEQGIPPELAFFDMALCLEVAEHLSKEAGDRLVNWLCNHAQVVVFSAAIPGQGGDGHLNEQYPSYWKERFLKQGFVASGFVRQELWLDQRVAPYYRQNLLVFWKNTPSFSGSYGDCFTQDVVHPEVFEAKRRR